MRSAPIVAILFAATVVMPAAKAGAPRGKGERAPLLANVVNCRTLKDPVERLACFDRSVAALDTAERNQAVIVVDQQQIHETRRNLFGISLPKLPIFGGSSDIDHIEATLAGAQIDGSGHWLFRMTDGTQWLQTDDNVIARRPRANDKIVVKRAALGSFRLIVADQPGVKARRLN